LFVFATEVIPQSKHTPVYPVIVLIISYAGRVR